MMISMFIIMIRMCVLIITIMLLCISIMNFLSARIICITRLTSVRVGVFLIIVRSCRRRAS